MLKETARVKALAHLHGLWPTDCPARAIETPTRTARTTSASADDRTDCSSSAAKVRCTRWRQKRHDLAHRRSGNGCQVAAWHFLSVCLWQPEPTCPQQRIPVTNPCAYLKCR